MESARDTRVREKFFLRAVELQTTKKKFAKYEDAVKIIQKGGADTFLKYNLDFASLSAKGIEEYNRDNLKAQIGIGRYTAKGYIKAQNYAQKLESEANVFVRVGFVSRWNAVYMYNGLRQDYVGSLKFAYEGLLVSVDVNVLDFMTDHEEGKSIYKSSSRWRAKTMPKLNKH